MVIRMKISWIKYDQDKKSFRLPEALGFDVFYLSDLEQTDKKMKELILATTNQGKLKEIKAMLKDIDIKCCDFKDFTGYKNCLFYFDPPYKGTKQYSKQFIDYNSFYDFLRKLSENNIVIISEYSMPDDFKCIWQKERKVLQKSDRTVGDKAIEKLFILEKND